MRFVVCKWHILGGRVLEMFVIYFLCVLVGVVWLVKGVAVFVS